MIIGITGKNGAGRKTMGEYLRKKGFQHFQMSNEIRKEAVAQGLDITFKNLIELGNQMREKFGPSVWAERIKTKLSENENNVVSSFFNTEEISGTVYIYN